MLRIINPISSKLLLWLLYYIPSTMDWRIFFLQCNYSGSREEVQLLADKSFGQPEKKLNFWLSSYLTIAKRIDSQIPDTDQWHRNLLTNMTQATNRRDPVLTLDLAYHLTDYLGFRHFYRHSYSFVLEWDELEKLVVPLEDTWRDTKAELNDFLQSLQ